LGFRAIALSAILGAVGLAHNASATPVTMNYCVQVESSGLYLYTVTMTLDNHDNSWTPGYGIGWIVFADSPVQQGSPLNDWVGDPSTEPIGPWENFSTTGGGHNGPNLSPVVVQQPPFDPIYWVPTAVGDFLMWRGESSHLVTPEQMQWSCLFTTGGAQQVNFEPMTNICGPQGGCCLPTGCRLTSHDVCTALGGNYSGDDTTCSSCPAAGACCNDGGCTQLTQAACATAGGSWQGAASPCPTANYSFGPNSGTFTDISTNGTNVTSQLSNCDDGGVVVPLPFGFSFFGTSYNEAWFCSNGFIQFGTTHSVDYNNLNPPSPSDPGNAIYGLWDDLYTCSDGAGGNLYYQVDGATPNRTITFSWQGVPKYSDQQNGSQNFQIILHETSNNIEFRYGSIAPDFGGGQGPGGGDYTIGVENAAKTAAFTILGSDIGSGNTARMLTYTPPHCGPSCGTADFNCDGDVGTDQDITGFFACLSGSCPAAPCTNSADFDGNGDVGTDQDIEAFFRVLSGGSC